MPIINIANPKCQLPPVLLFDASVLLALRDKTTNRAKQVKNFLNRISDESAAGRIMCLAPVITFEECYFKLINNYYASILPSHKPRLSSLLGKTEDRVTWHDLYKDSPNLIKNCIPLIHSFRQQILNIPITPIEPEDYGKPPPRIEPTMLHYIEDVPILPKDAYLLAAAQRFNVPHLATLDRDFGSAKSWLTVYTLS